MGITPTIITVQLVLSVGMRMDLTSMITMRQDLNRATMNQAIGQTKATSPLSTVKDHRILWLTDHYHPGSGGMARSCDRIVHHLRKLGVLVDLVHFTPARAGGWRWEARQSGNDFVCPLKTDRPHTLNLLWEALQGRRYTQIVAFGAETPLLAAPVYAKWLGIPMVTCLRGNDFDTGIFSTKKRAILMDALEASRVIACVSGDKVSKVRALLPATQVVHTPNGIDLTQWKHLPSHHWKKHPGKLTLGLFGQFKAKKGLELFFQAVIRSGLAEQLHLMIVGQLGVPAAEFLATHRDRLSYDYHAFGSRSDLPARYASCDYVVIPSFYDGMPNVLLEAGGLGVPVIASDTGGMRDVLIDQEHGFLFSVNDVDACAQAIRNGFQTHDDERRGQGEKLQTHIAQHYTCVREANTYLEIFTNQSVIER